MSRLDQMLIRCALAIFALCFFYSPAASQASSGYVNFMIGQKMFDSDDWSPIDKQTSFGAEGVFGPGKWPVRLDAYVARASKSKDQTISGVQGTLEGTTYEFGLGLNKTWTAKKLYPYLNAGVVHAKVNGSFSQSGTSGSDHATGLGFWGGAGAFYRVGTTFNIGAAGRYSSVDVNFNPYTGVSGVPVPGGDIKAGGFTLGVLLGWGWPKTP